MELKNEELSGGRSIAVRSAQPQVSSTWPVAALLARLVLATSGLSVPLLPQNTLCCKWCAVSW